MIEIKEFKRVCWITSKPSKYFFNYSGTLKISSKGFKHISNLNYIPRRIVTFNWEKIKKIEQFDFPYKSKIFSSKTKNLTVVRIHLKNSEEKHQYCYAACASGRLQKAGATSVIEQFDSNKTIDMAQEFIKIFNSRSLTVSTNPKLGSKSFLVSSAESIEKLEKLHVLLKKSSKIPLSMIRNYLNIESSQFDRLIINWVLKYNLKINGDFIESQEDSLHLIMETLDNDFEKWENQEKSKSGKI
jgi:hypothetical protein